MKKIYLLLGSILLLFNACSSDSSDNGAAGPLLKKVTLTVDNGSDYVYEYHYNGNKITSIDLDSDTEIQYTYTGDQITGQKKLSGGLPYAESQYSYDNSGRLIKEHISDEDSGYEELAVYTYNSDNTVTRQMYDGDVVTPAALYLTSKISLNANGQFIKLEDFENDNWVTKLEATYSSYYSPLRNITGFDKILPFTDVKNGFATYAQYNNISGINNSSVFEYTVNAANYPTHRVQTLANADGTSSVAVSTYIYY